MTRLSRPCYDKFWRCPGWAGGGFKFARTNRCTCSGSMHGIYDRRLALWRPYWNRECGVLVLPSMVRWLDPAWWRWKVRWWWRDLTDGW